MRKRVWCHGATAFLLWRSAALHFACGKMFVMLFVTSGGGLALLCDEKGKEKKKVKSEGFKLLVLALAWSHSVYEESCGGRIPKWNLNLLNQIH